MIFSFWAIIFIFLFSSFILSLFSVIWIFHCRWYSVDARVVGYMNLVVSFIMFVLCILFLFFF